MSLFDRITDFFDRKDKERAAAQTELSALEDELRLLEAEARYQEEPAFRADLARRAGELEGETRLLIYEAREPQRSMAQGRCQRLLEDVERPDTVRSRIGEVKSRIAELTGRTRQPADGDTVDERDATS